MENLPDDIHVIKNDEGSLFGMIDILFDTDFKNENVFKVRVDSDFYLCEDGKLREDPAQAGIFYKDSSKRKYPHITNRAMECVAYCLQERFPKVF